MRRRPNPIAPLRPALLRLVSLGALLLFAACSSSGSRSDSVGNVTRLNAADQLEKAEAEMQAGKLEKALDRLIALRELQGLSPERRNRIEDLLEACAGTLMETYRGSDYDSRDYEELYQQDLSPRLKARAGVLAALYMLEEGSPRRAAKMIRKVEKKLPSHSERALAGEVLARAGLQMAEEGGRYFLFFSYRSRGIEALEFLVLAYPFDSHCPEAYHVLATLYEERDDLNLAIERTEDLLIFHPGSAYSVEAQLSLPRLRMKRLRRDDQDRDELVLAHQEVRAWLERYDGHELTQEAHDIERHVTRRLARSDLGLAAFYDRIGNPAGTRLHAERALEYATAAGADSQIRDANRLLEALAPAPASSAMPPVEAEE